MTAPTERTAALRAVTSKPRLTPPEASAYLSSQHCLKVAVATLATWRTNGGGPVYRKAGTRVLYDVVALDAWADQRLGRELRSTSDAGTVQ